MGARIKEVHFYPEQFTYQVILLDGRKFHYSAEVIHKLVSD